MPTETSGKKRKIKWSVIVPIVISIIAIIVPTYLQITSNWLNIQTNEASIGYEFMNYTPAVYNSSSSVDIYCYNSGNIDGYFNLTLSLVNATISEQTQVPYEQVKDNCFSIAYELPKAGDSEETVNYIVNPNATSFSILLSIIKVSSPMTSAPHYPIQLEYVYNAFSSDYDLLWTSSGTGGLSYVPEYPTIITSLALVIILAATALLALIIRKKR